jgi:hypothetical protein
MSVRPVGSSPKSGPVSQVRKKDTPVSGAEASFAELTAAPVADARAAGSADREPVSGGAGSGGDALANISAAYFLFGGGKPDGGGA